MKVLKGEAAFDQFFTEVYGERWAQIKLALNNDDAKIARQNLFYQSQSPVSLVGVGEPVSGVDNAFAIDEDFDLGQWTEQQLPFYRMDPASLFPAKALAVAAGDQVLDMCAAPGGKTLVLMEDLAGLNGQSEPDLSGQMVANELSPKRRHRMMSVFKRYLPKEVRSMIRITGADGSRIGLERKEVFDKILLDAPCSGERGLIHKPADLETWKVKRTKSFGIRQYALLASAFMALKPGGRLVYSTCSISPHENDGVISKLGKRQKDLFTVVFDQDRFGERTEFGTQFLPDRSGWGPIYYSIIEKK